MECLTSLYFQILLECKLKILFPIIYVYGRIFKCSETLLLELNSHRPWPPCPTQPTGSDFPCADQSHWVYSAFGHTALSISAHLLAPRSCALVMERLSPAHPCCAASYSTDLHMTPTSPTRIFTVRVKQHDGGENAAGPLYVARAGQWR